MRIRSAVTALGATLALAVMLTTTTTPAFAARPNKEHKKPPTVVELQDSRSKGEQGRSQLTSTTMSSRQELPQTPPGSSISAVTSGPVYQQGTASVASNGNSTANGSSNSTANGGSSSNGYGNSNGAPVLPSGSIVPSNMAGPTYQQGASQGAGIGNSGLTYPQAAGQGTGATSTGPTYPQGAAPLFQGPGSSVASGNTGPAYQQGPGSSINLVNSGPQSQAMTDVRVVYVNSAWNSNSTLYHFRVENASVQPATGISLSSVVREQSGSTNATRRVEEQYPQIASLAAGQAQDVVVTCTPQAGFQCVSGGLDAFVANDLNPANNGAHS